MCQYHHHETLNRLRVKYLERPVNSSSSHRRSRHSSSSSRGRSCRHRRRLRLSRGRSLPLRDRLKGRRRCPRCRCRLPTARWRWLATLGRRHRRRRRLQQQAGLQRLNHRRHAAARCAGRRRRPVCGRAPSVDEMSVSTAASPPPFLPTYAMLTLHSLDLLSIYYAPALQEGRNAVLRSVRLSVRLFRLL